MDNNTPQTEEKKKSLLPKLKRDLNPNKPKSFKSQYLSLLTSEVDFSSSYLLKYWQWAGFSEKKLWDYLGLILILIPLLINILSSYLNNISSEIQQIKVDSQNAKEQAISKNRYHQEILSKYFQEITQLVLEKDQLKSKQGSVSWTVARFKTLSALEGLELDRKRRGLLLRFLVESNLVTCGQVVIRLDDAKLNSADLSGADLSRVNLSRASLSFAYFKATNLSHANLNKANLEFTNLSGANLNSTDLDGANLQGANLEGARSLTVTQIKAAKNWEKAHYSPDFRQQLGLPAKSSKADEGEV